MRIDGAGNNTIGGTTAANRNVISGNLDSGIYLTDGASGNRVIGNYLGVDSTGATAMANAAAGIHLRDGAANNTIGGTTAAERNVLSGNTLSGVIIGDSAGDPDHDNSGVSGNLVEGNYIGLNAAGTAALGNGTNGVFIGDGAHDNNVGFNVAGAGNVIAGNTTNGVRIAGTGTAGNKVRATSSAPTRPARRPSPTAATASTSSTGPATTRSAGPPQFP